MRKPAYLRMRKQWPDQLCGNRTADQRLCFCYIDSTLPLLPISRRARWLNGRALGPEREVKGLNPTTAV